MRKLVIYAIVVDIILGLIYAYSSIVVWNYFNNWAGYNIVWSPLFITPHTVSEMSLPPQLHSLPNFSFLLFWVILAINICFIVILGRRNEAKQNPSQNTHQPS